MLAYCHTSSASGCDAPCRAVDDLSFFPEFFSKFFFVKWNGKRISTFGPIFNPFRSPFRSSGTERNGTDFSVPRRILFLFYFLQIKFFIIFIGGTEKSVPFRSTRSGFRLRGRGTETWSAGKSKRERTTERKFSKRFVFVVNFKKIFLCKI